MNGYFSSIVKFIVIIKNLYFLYVCTVYSYHNGLSFPNWAYGTFLLTIKLINVPK